jgi:hypothetical protein
LYRELLAREPDAQGQKYWLSILGGDGASSSERADVVRGFLNSPEYRLHFVNTLYQTFLDRAPDAAGLQFFADKLESLDDLAEIVVYIAGSQEYFVRNGDSNQSFVNALYRDLLGRATDPGAAAWVNELNSSAGGDHQAISRDDVVRSLLFSSEGMHKLMNANYLSLIGPMANAPAGDPQSGAYALATATGNGFGNLFFQGKLSPAAIDEAVSQLQKGTHERVNTVEDLITLLSGDQYYG